MSQRRHQTQQVFHIHTIPGGCCACFSPDKDIQQGRAQPSREISEWLVDLHPATLSRISVTFENRGEEITIVKERSNLFPLHQDHLATSQSCCFDLVSSHGPVLYGHAAWNACRLRSSWRVSRVNKIDLDLRQLRLAVLHSLSCTLWPFLSGCEESPALNTTLQEVAIGLSQKTFCTRFLDIHVLKTVARNAEGPTNIFSSIKPVPFNP